MMSLIINNLLHQFSLLIYSLAIPLYRFVIIAISPVNARAKAMVDGQKNNWKLIEDKLINKNEKRVWFHVASVGEYEQARPIMEAILQSNNSCKIVCTFFSPSGYNALKNDTAAHYKFYLPFDSRNNAKRLLELINPSIAFWVKYDFWYYYLHQLHKQKIPVYLLSAAFINSQIYFAWYGVFFKNILTFFTTIFTQNSSTTQLLKSINIKSIESKDTRFDKVYSTAKFSENIPQIERFKDNNFLIVAGSSYAIEENILKQFLHQNKHSIKLIIAPHFVNKKRIEEIENTFKNECIKWSDYKNSSNHTNKNILILDSIGMLSKTYRYADVAFIGGGFLSGGLHNILEAACFGVPTIFGNKINKFAEASDLINCGGAISIKDESDFIAVLKLLMDDKNKINSASQSAQNFIQKNIGATDIVMANINVQ